MAKTMYVRTNQQLADVRTKALCPTPFRDLIGKMGVLDIYAPPSWEGGGVDNDPMDGDFLLFSYDGCRIFLVSIFRDELPVKPKAPVNIQEISDEDETAEEDNDQNMIISLSSGSSEEDNVDTLTKLMEVQGELRLRKGNVLKLLVIQRCILMIPLTLSVDMP
ncbi:hypothetical protein Bca4012_045142 [Brassica carinata]